MLGIAQGVVFVAVIFLSLSLTLSTCSFISFLFDNDFIWESEIMSSLWVFSLSLTWSSSSPLNVSMQSRSRWSRWSSGVIVIRSDRVKKGWVIYYFLYYFVYYDFHSIIGVLLCNLFKYLDLPCYRVTPVVIFIT